MVSYEGPKSLCLGFGCSWLLYTFTFWSLYLVPLHCPTPKSWPLPQHDSLSHSSFSLSPLFHSVNFFPRSGVGSSVTETILLCLVYFSASDSKIWSNRERSHAILRKVLLCKQRQKVTREETEWVLPDSTYEKMPVREVSLTRFCQSIRPEVSMEPKAVWRYLLIFSHFGFHLREGGDINVNS